jgi:hypothetical protein
MDYPLNGAKLESVAEDPIDTHFVVLGALIFFLVMAVFAALGFQP